MARAVQAHRPLTIPTASTSCAVVGLESGPRSTSQTPPIERKSCRFRTNKIALLQNFAAQADRLGEALEGERTELFSCDGSLHRTDSGHSPWQREPLFVPPWHS